MRFSPRARLALWIGFTLLPVVPWTGFQNHTHWSRVQWVPFVTPPIRIVDLVVNVLLYVAFGYWFIEASNRGIAYGARRVRRSTLGGNRMEPAV